jgi:hypothetical protein
VRRNSFKLESDPDIYIAEAAIEVVEKVERDTKGGEENPMLSKEEHE